MSSWASLSTRMDIFCIQMLLLLLLGSHQTIHTEIMPLINATVMLLMLLMLYMVKMVILWRRMNIVDNRR